MLYVMEDSASAEIAVVGNDGLIGIALFMGGDTTPSRAVVQSAGKALIGNMLGVRRSGVTVEAANLQRAGVIRCQRGRIEVLDRPRLEALCCECYGVVKRETDRLLPQVRVLRR